MNVPAPGQSSVAAALDRVLQRIASAEATFGRVPGDVRLLAVSKTRGAADVGAALAAGQFAFGENQLADAMSKVTVLDDPRLEWHFIGPLQSNKTRTVAERFHWVHSIDREKTARRLSEQRPSGLAPLNVCLQFNVSNEATKAGVTTDELSALAHVVARLPDLVLRGIMAIPAPSDDFAAQRRAFAAVRRAYDALIAGGFALDTLSMGMSDDLEAAIAEGATMVRIGTAIFGPRRPGAAH